MKLVEITNEIVWNRFVNSDDRGHPLQLWGWGEAKKENGWSAYRLMSDDNLAGAQVLMWPIPKTGRCIAYIPRGPICAPIQSELLLSALALWAKNNKALYLRVEPAWLVGSLPAGWKQSKNGIQLAETYTIDLTLSEPDLLGAMERKHRQYINKSEREGVVVRRETAGNLDSMWSIYQETALRAGFGTHTKHYYEGLQRDLGDSNWIYYAEVDGKPEAFLWIAAGGRTAYELYGGITSEGQTARANYILKWTAMRELRNAGYTIYDFNGRLNEGVSRFKEGFGPLATNYVGTWDYPVNMFGYMAWEKFWPVIKPVGRKILKAIGK